MMQAAKEHMLSVLKLMYDSRVRLFKAPVWSFVEDEKPYSIGIEITENVGKICLNSELTKNAFTSTFKHREGFRLLLDGIDDSFPLQYRFLSLYRLLELYLKQNGKWDEKHLDQLLSQASESFVPEETHMGSTRYIHFLRDKYAHIKTGKKKEVFGVTHLNQKQAILIEKALPVLMDICMDLLNEEAGSSFALSRRGTLPYWGV